MYSISKNRLIGVGALVLAVVAGTAISLSGKGQNSGDLVAATQVQVGATAPNFTAVDSNGKTHSLTDFRGKTVVLEWTNHDCPFVRKHYDTSNMQKLQKTATGQGVVWLSIVSSGPGQQGFVNGAKANELTKSRNASPTAVLLDPDGKVGRLYGAKTTPHMFVVAPNGNLAYMGAIDDKPTANKDDVATAKNYILPALDAVKANRTVAISTTQPYGCSVKYGK